MRRRWWVLVWGGLIWAGLDAARSWNAREAYRRPRVAFNSAGYTALSWPPGSSLPPETPLGTRVFVQRCAVCHGLEGRGNGPASPTMQPRPADLTTGRVKFKSTAAGQSPSDEDLRRTVRNGLSASPMPYFSDVLSEEELTAVVEHVKSLAGRAGQPSPPALVPPPPPAFSPELVERGKGLYAKLRCAGCHGEDGRLRLAADTPAGRVMARDLSQPWTFRGGAKPEQLWLRLTTGLLPSPMPSYAEAATPEERWALVAYVVSLAQPAPWTVGGKLGGLGQHPDLLVRGRYMSSVQVCALCHTTADPTGIYYSGSHLGGGMRVEAYPHPTAITANLTNVRHRSEEELMAIIRDGRMPERQVNFWSMTWPMFRALSDDDARGLARYLRSLEPLPREIPEPVAFGIIETVVAKLSRGAPPFLPEKLVYGLGDFGGLPSGAPLQRKLALGQWLVALLTALAFVALTPKGRRVPRGTRGWVKAALLALALGLVWLVLDLIYQLPAYRRVPPERVERQVLAGLPPVDAQLAPTPELRALAERGRYLFNVSSCILCHGARGNGGATLSWKPFGTLYARNLTSHPKLGLGEWTDAQIARAIRSGISRDGRALHWQGMTWDIFSNLEEEDVRALVLYLRMLPPEETKVNAPVPPSEKDCDDYSIFVFSPNRPPGC